MSPNQDSRDDQRAREANARPDVVTSPGTVEEQQDRDEARRVSRTDDKADIDVPPAKTKAEGSAADKGGDELSKDFLRRPLVAVAVGLIFLAVSAAGYVYWDYARHFEWTDDAFIDSREFTVAPKVSGYITAVPVTDNQHVSVGEMIARIEDRDYRIALAQAEAEVAASEASIQKVDEQIKAQQAQVDEVVAQEKQAQAALEFAQVEALRAQELARRGAGTIQRAQQATSEHQQRLAELARTQAAIDAAQRQLRALRAQRASAEASLAQAKAQVDQAKLNLEYTTVTAAQAGRIARLTAAVGQFAQAGQSLSMFVPDVIWVTANYKETQLDRMRPSQPVDISIDAYPGRIVHGHVDSVQPGSGTAFSLLPAENATGNYVKVVQRVPVKIVMEDVPTDVTLGPGMSVVPTTRVWPDPSLYERVTGG